MNFLDGLDTDATIDFNTSVAEVAAMAGRFPTQKFRYG